MKDIVLTTGEPAGIGPEIVVRLLAERGAPGLVVTGNAELLAHTAERLGLELPDDLRVVDLPLARGVRPGELDVANAAFVLSQLEHAADGCLGGRYAAMVTAPVHKGIINEAGIGFSGHTEFLAERCGVPQVVMMLATPRLRVALVTTHLPLREVADAITPARLRSTVHILHKDLQEKFGVARPHIAVLGLNPHAGEGGHLGDEEQRVIEPTLAELAAEGLRVAGPIPADTAFAPGYIDRFDAILAMYHDQGLPVLKSQGFGEAVNVTLGLPIVRTSVDHGTALDIAGTGQASHSSLGAALDMARSMVGA